MLNESAAVSGMPWSTLRATSRPSPRHHILGRPLVCCCTGSRKTLGAEFVWRPCEKKAQGFKINIGAGGSDRWRLQRLGLLALKLVVESVKSRSRTDLSSWK